MKLETDRLILREFNNSDRNDVHLYASDSESTQYMDWGPNTLNETSVFISTMLAAQSTNPRKSYVLGITLKGQGQIIGSIGFEIKSLDARDASFGYILRKDHWGKGLVTEASRRIIEFAEHDLRIHRLWATCRPENTKSMSVLNKLHFQKEGHLRHDKYIRGVYRDSILFARLLN